MRTRMTALAVAISAVLTLGVGAAIAMPSAGSGWDPDQMHNSQQMQAMHAEMPADLQAQCDAMHAQMSAQMGSMRGQSGMGSMHGQRGMGAMHEQSGMGSMHGEWGGGRR
jgi:hypothetical protein